MLAAPQTTTTNDRYSRMAFLQKLTISRKKMLVSTDPSCEMGCESNGKSLLGKADGASYEDEDTFFLQLESGELGAPVKQNPNTLTIQEHQKTGGILSEDEFLWSNPGET